MTFRLQQFSRVDFNLLVSARVYYQAYCHFTDEFKQQLGHLTFKKEAQTALFKDPVRTVQ
jgi:hypothetical protein